jgi:hypothetical protein
MTRKILGKGGMGIMKPKSRERLIRSFIKNGIRFNTREEFMEVKNEGRLKFEVHLDSPDGVVVAWPTGPDIYERLDQMLKEIGK